MINVNVTIIDKGDESEVYADITTHEGTTEKETALAEGIEKMIKWYIKSVANLSEVKK